MHTTSLRRIQLLARQSESLCILLRPSSVMCQASMAVLRLAIEPCRQGIRLHILKRQGAAASSPINLELYAPQGGALPRHVPVGLPALA